MKLVLNSDEGFLHTYLEEYGLSVIENYRGSSHPILCLKINYPMTASAICNIIFFIISSNFFAVFCTKYNPEGITLMKMKYFINIYLHNAADP